MGMLAPKFNHLGRSKKRTLKPTKELTAAKKEHEKFLASLGIKPKTRRQAKPKGITSPLTVASFQRKPDIAATSDKVL